MRTPNEELLSVYIQKYISNIYLINDTVLLLESIMKCKNTTCKLYKSYFKRPFLNLTHLGLWRRPYGIFMNRFVLLTG